MTIIAPPDVRSTGIRRFRRARRTRSLACAGLFAALAGCAAQPATERQIGSGGSLVRYSSSQTEVDLTDAEQQALRMLSDRSYAGATQAHVLDAVAGVLRAQGYAPVTVERDTGLVEAGRSDTLLPKWRQLLRGAVKARIGFLPAKPDHERVAAIVTVRLNRARATRSCVLGSIARCGTATAIRAPRPSSNRISTRRFSRKWTRQCARRRAGGGERRDAPTSPRTASGS
ncbi:hypothetical protein [Burkholderia ubonensis]|uniref:hypothetical protein n=1 Tax=Burkholderia ubonensis TaxID=101571 RepID=UPI000AD92409|nr:hypothetical protein [Burkholderia ubonensis]